MTRTPRERDLARYEATLTETVRERNEAQAALRYLIGALETDDVHRITEAIYRAKQAAK